MTQLFSIRTPEQLHELAQFTKAGNVENVAKVWSASRRRGGGSCPWDGKVMVSFYEEIEGNQAIVFRIDTMGELLQIATLNYDPALAWCKEHLTMVDVK